MKIRTEYQKQVVYRALIRELNALMKNEERTMEPMAKAEFGRKRKEVKELVDQLR